MDGRAAGRSRKAVGRTGILRPARRLRSPGGGVRAARPYGDSVSVSLPAFLTAFSLYAQGSRSPLAHLSVWS